MGKIKNSYSEKRKSGLSLLPEIARGTSLCQFYQTKQDLLDILVPYFKAGLKNNEACLWITSGPLSVEEVQEALKNAIPYLRRYVKTGQLEITSYYRLKAQGETFNKALVSRIDRAITQGFDNLRLSFIVSPRDRGGKGVAVYKEADEIANHNVIALFAYPREEFDAIGLMEVVKKHQCALLRNGVQWEVIESTEANQTRDIVKKSEQRYRSLFDNMLDGYAFCRMIFKNGQPQDFVYLAVNGVFESLTGLKDVVGKRISQVLPGLKETNPELFEIYGRVALTGQPERCETYITPLKIWLSISVYCPEKGTFTAVFENITERKKIEEALRRSEQRWATTLSSIGDAVIATDMAGKITFMNAVAEDLTGWKMLEAIGKPVAEIFDIINEHTRQKVDNPVMKVLQQGTIVGLANHTVLVRKDGSEIAIDDSGAPIKDESGQITGVVLIFRDITERRRLEEAITYERDKLSNILNSMEDGVYIVNRDYDIEYVNPALKSLFGPVADQKCYQYFHQQPHVCSWCRNAEIFQGRRVHWELHFSKTDRFYDMVGAPLKNPDGTISAQELMHDITERKIAEEAALKAKNEWELTFNSVPDLIAILDCQHRVVRANNAMADRLGITPDKCVGLHCYEVVHGTPAPPNFCPHSLTCQDGQEHTTDVHEPRLGGDFLVSTTPVRDEQGNIIRSIHVARDITDRKKAEDELGRQRNILQIIMDNAHTHLVFLDRDFNFVAVNAAYAQNCKKTPEELIGKNHFYFYPDEENEAIFKRVRDTGKAESYFDKPFVFPDQPERGVTYWDWTLTPIKDSTGIVQGLVFSLVETTEHKQNEMALRETQDYLNNLLDYANAPIIVWDPLLRITRFNHAFERLTGRSADEVIGKPLDILFPEDSREYSMGYIRKAIAGERWETVEIPILRTNGNVRTVLWNSANLHSPDGKIIATIAQGQDITERKEAEESLKRYAAELEAANKELESFSYSVSHDLRAPLRGIDGFSNALLEDYRDKLDAQGQDYLDRIRKSSQLMSQLIDGMLKLSRISRVEMHPDKVNLSEIVHSIAEELKQSQSERKAEFNISPDVTAYGDTVLLEALLRNLLENAWKFTGKCAETRIEFGITRKDNLPVYYVKDNGIGFDMKYSDKLFKPFSRLHNQKDYPGTGIGLANVQRIVRRHGGNIWAEGEVGKGATFYFFLGN